MATPKTPAKTRARKTTDTPPEPTLEAAPAEPAKKPARKRATKAAEPAPVEAAPQAPVPTATAASQAPAAAAPIPTVTADAEAVRREIRRRAYALYAAGSRDTFANWIRAEREVLGR